METFFTQCSFSMNAAQGDTPPVMDNYFFSFAFVSSREIQYLRNLSLQAVGHVLSFFLALLVA